MCHFLGLVHSTYGVVLHIKISSIILIEQVIYFMKDGEMHSYIHKLLVCSLIQIKSIILKILIINMIIIVIVQLKKVD